MKNLNELAKSRGVLLFANNTETVNYAAIAERSAELISKYLKLPTTIVSTSAESTNKRYNLDSGKFEIWNNQKRYMAYELSPYDQTLLLDADYFVLSDNLLKILDSLRDYKIISDNHYLDGTIVVPMGKYSIPHLWATVVAFERSPRTELLFDMVARIERNYGYYRQLYNITANNYRNDYAFTIADLVINGYTQDSRNYIPWPMLSVSNIIGEIKLLGNQIRIKSQNNAWVIPKQDIHIMSKEWLTSEECQQFIRDAVHATI